MVAVKTLGEVVVVTGIKVKRWRRRTHFLPGLLCTGRAAADVTEGQRGCRENPGASTAGRSFMQKISHFGSMDDALRAMQDQLFCLQQHTATHRRCSGHTELTLREDGNDVAFRSLNDRWHLQRRNEEWESLPAITGKTLRRSKSCAAIRRFTSYSGCLFNTHEKLF